MTTKVVPREPTEEMVKAGQISTSGYPRPEAVTAHWKAMYDASPAVGERPEPVAWDAPGPQITSDDQGPEPSLRRVLELYYQSYGCSDVERLAQDYITAYASPVEPSAPPEPDEVDGPIAPMPVHGTVMCVAREQPAQDDDAALIERIKALADCAYWASAGWDIPGDATQKIGRLAVKAAARLAALRDQVAERDKHHAEWCVLHQKEIDDAHRQRLAAEQRVRDQQGEIERLRAAIEWALGERGEFQERPASRGRYWWRTELRERAAIAAAKPDSAR